MGRRKWVKMSLSRENTPVSPPVPQTSSRNTHRSSYNVPPLPPEDDTAPGTSASTAGNDDGYNIGHQQCWINPGPGVNFNSNSMPYCYMTPSRGPPMLEGYQYSPYQFNQNSSQWHFQQAHAFNPNWYNQQYNTNQQYQYPLYQFDQNSGQWHFQQVHAFNPNWYHQQYNTNHGSNGNSSYVTSYNQYGWTFPPLLPLPQNQYFQFYNGGWINNNQVGSQASGWFTNYPYNVFACPTEEMMVPFEGSTSQDYASLPQEMTQPDADYVPPPSPPPACAPSSLPAIVSPPSPAIVSPPSPAILAASAVSPLCSSEDSLLKEQADKLSSQIRQQIEYYLSEQNFSTDDTLKSLLDENGWISINKMVKVKKIIDIPSILKALKSSTSIEVQGYKIRRHTAQSTSHCLDDQKSSKFNSSDANKNSRAAVVEHDILEANRDIDICLPTSDSRPGEPRADRNEPSLEQSYSQQSLMVEPTNNTANENSALDDCLSSGNPSIKNLPNLSVCLDTSNSQKYSNDGMNDHNFGTVSFIGSGRDGSEHTATSEDDGQLPIARIDREDYSSDQRIPSVVTQEIDGKKVGKYALETVSGKYGNLLDEAVLHFQQDELAMHSICQRPNTVTRLFNHDISFYDAASGGKRKNKGNSKSDSSNNLHLFSSSFRCHSSSGSQQETGSESLIGRSLFFMGPTPPENDSRNEVLSGMSPPVAAIRKYSEFHKHCISDWLSKGKGCSEELFKLFRFWSYFLREHFSKSVYEKFKMLAVEDFSSDHDYGIQCLFRFFSSGLKKRFNEGIYKDFEKLAVEFYQKGYLYGVEKYWEFHHRRIMDRAIKMHPILEKLLSEEYQNIYDFHYKKIRSRQE